MIEKGKFYYPFYSYIITWILEKCCCGFCFKRTHCYFNNCWKKRKFEYDRYEKAVDSLTEDIDILKYI